MAGTEWNPREPDVSRFTEGDCHVLARELSKLTGWPCVTFDYPNDPRGSIHCAVQMPDGRIMDVLGIHDPGDFSEMWADFGYPKFSQRSKRIMRQWGGAQFGSYSYERARVLARRLLYHFDIPFKEKT